MKTKIAFGFGVGGVLAAGVVSTVIGCMVIDFMIVSACIGTHKAWTVLAPSWLTKGGE